MASKRIHVLIADSAISYRSIHVVAYGRQIPL